ncbi:3-phosphoshikimate 1-carboxyvinyltransferase [Aureibacter tunicatorum]|uniref:3-phosphoshikimate 1-carboxyvinyltransferase n=1 Tax=Aureibacter tunicatorum TaxID=866807 RepID=A0AAE4BQX9_9BACT|nr:3-phosphoshikimate 1-carboxyvinyltransferase [Aureibacter tunicatorum]MDR6239649.1 3-phosphoshikimate 1-carboxyvinyltransferase [Aureibacter tunicatorum]BDD04125.1 3-phosphoshikimate 1-carboxyvinyltransferase [Aureibacter tunicatorum]
MNTDNLKQQEQIQVRKPKSTINSSILLPSSKSESNRSLIIDALTGHQCQLINLSEARDTQTMIRLLKSEGKILDVLDAGTTMRFLTSYCALTNKLKTLTGTERMQERPIKILVDALREIGADIDYLNQEGYPPIESKGFTGQKKSEISIPGDVSSQYISALIMVAPYLNNGLNLRLTGKIGSKPYIEMTLQLMRQFGADAKFISDDTIQVKPGTYLPSSYQIESDWSGASYWFSIVSLMEGSKVELLGLRKNSLQGDIKIVEIMSKLGVKSTFVEDGIILEHCATKKETSIDFSDCPDLAQTVIALCAAKGIKCEMTGLESLRIKETDRIAAMQTEIQRFGAQLIENDSKDKWEVIPAPTNWEKNFNYIDFDTYDDHRMAMALAPLAIVLPVNIKEPIVVNKSYPRYWENLLQAGFEIK